MNYKLYLITDQSLLHGKNLMDSIADSIKGGVTVVQLREKSISSKDYIRLSLQVKKVTDYYHIPLIINDRVDIALAVDATGVHLGLDDMPIHMARKLLGPYKQIGASACTIVEAIRLEKEGANYLGVGAMFPTTTKSDTDKVTVTELSQIVQSVKIPIVAIGGIHENNVALLQGTKIAGIAVSSGILGKENVAKAAEKLSNMNL